MDIKVLNTAKINLVPRMKLEMNTLKIPRGQSEDVNGRRTHNTITNRKRTNGKKNNLQNITQKTKDRAA